MQQVTVTAVLIDPLVALEKLVKYIIYSILTRPSLKHALTQFSVLENHLGVFNKKENSLKGLLF